MTYGFLLLFVFVRTMSCHKLLVYINYLKLFTIIAYYLNAHIMLLRYVICDLHMTYGSLNYELYIYVNSKMPKLYITFVSHNLRKRIKVYEKNRVHLGFLPLCIDTWKHTAEFCSKRKHFALRNDGLWVEKFKKQTRRKESKALKVKSPAFT